MIIYRDILTGDELFSDNFKVELVGPNKNIIRIKVKRVSESTSVDIDIGANPSAEEQAEALEEGVISNFNVCTNHQLQEVPGYTLKEYQGVFKKYVKKLEKKKQEEIEELENEGNKGGKADKLKEELENFKATIGDDVKQVFAQGLKKKEFQFFSGESMDPEAMIALLSYADNDPDPYMYYIKFGLLEEKQ
ncbi:translationally-controlled tumor protein homolog [Lytechinus variegatus]|uniref:translationally-controlled tumor protein homolog n=1 Tax=Lytechinus variegatus TaxID=7654 RepID=UPI001BB0F5BF|nr:translationally-controlled tumor protein homolog [Lytechinus variegatus]